MELMNKKEVAAKFGICERSVELLVKRRQFPPPLRLGKSARWAKPAVEKWFLAKLQPQLDWAPPGRKPRKSAGTPELPQQG